MNARRAAQTGLLVAVCVACLLASGCVRRRLTIRSNPPGAQVYVDGYEIGTTPCSTNFIYYGTRDITLVKSGYETLKVKQSFPTPWYQIPPLDFVSENLVPGEIRDERALNFTLTPQILVPTDQLLSRAEQLRRGANAPPPVPGMPVVSPPAASPAGIETLPPGGRPVPENVAPPVEFPSGSTAPPPGVLPPPSFPAGQPPPGQFAPPPASAPQPLPGTFPLPSPGSAAPAPAGQFPGPQTPSTQPGVGGWRY